MGRHRKSNVTCGDCGGKLTKKGYCYRCKTWPGKEGNTSTINVCAADTIHARPAEVKADEPVTPCDAIVQVKLLHHDAKVPEYKTAGAAGFDLCSVTDGRLIRPGETAIFHLGIAFAIPEGFEIQIRPRSGLSFNGPLMAKNTIGTIDSDYRGEIAFALYNTGDEPAFIDKGDRICQGVLARVPRAGFMLVDELPATARGKNGFGSTGK